MLRRYFLILLSFLGGSVLQAREINDTVSVVRDSKYLDVSFSAGTLGLGVEAATPLNRSLKLRAGVYYMPKFKPTMSFGVGLEKDGVSGPVSSERFNEIAELFTAFTGCQVDDKIDMIGEPTLLNFSLLMDVAPFKDKRWHFTAGVFAGPSRIGKAYNTTEDMPSLFSVLLYNKMYESAYNDVPMFVYGDKAVYVDPELADKLLDYGRMTINIGDMADGSGACRLMPNAESMMKVKMKVNPIRPYVGFGFHNQFKNRKHQNTSYGFGFDAGVMFWGGSPQVITQRYVEHYDEENEVFKGELQDVDLVKDVVNVKGKVGDYVRFVKRLKVCPMLSLQLTKRINW